MDTICVGITAKGDRCAKKRVAAVGDGTRCRIHHKFVENHGPNRAQLKELQFKQKKEYNTMLEAYSQVLHGLVGPDRDAVILRRQTEINMLQARHVRDRTDMRHRHTEEILRTGVDPDVPARMRRAAQEELRRERAHAFWQQIRGERHGLLGPAPPAPAPVPVERDLRNFVNDNQNVHTTEAVKQTKEIVERIRKIPVPDDYKWDGKRLRTVGEIMCECWMSPSAAAQMFNQYVSRVSVYEIEEGIYGKVLDSVWQYIKGHTDKECLIGILKQELEDNIGMCAQGNLSRICNVVAGFMEGVGSQESLAERLGRLLSPLMAVEDAYDRMHAAYTIMKENNVPHDDWETWAGPLVDEEVEDTIDLVALRRQFVDA